jgi:hypothetical protein
MTGSRPRSPWSLRPRYLSDDAQGLSTERAARTLTETPRQGAQNGTSVRAEPTITRVADLCAVTRGETSAERAFGATAVSVVLFDVSLLDSHDH